MTWKEWVGYYRIYKKEFWTSIVTIVAMILISVLLICNSAKSGSEQVDADLIDGLIELKADEAGVTVYPFRVNKIKTEIENSGDYSVTNIEDIINKNIEELKHIK